MRASDYAEHRHFRDDLKAQRIAVVDDNVAGVVEKGLFTTKLTRKGYAESAWIE